MVQYVLTPWRDRRELLLVRQQFYDGHDDGSNGESRTTRMRAVARVSMWMQRGNCPHMVESTALLMAAVLSDEDASSTLDGDGAASAAYAVRAAYSAAFSRFVTGLLDGHQDKQRKQSMYSIAKTIGLPATFVELRHQSTHEQLPSLAKLRNAAKQALKWIWEYYWKQLPDEDDRQTDPIEMEILRYLKEEDEGRRRNVVQGLVRLDMERVTKSLKGLQATLPGNQAYIKCLRLSKELVEEVSKPSQALPLETKVSIGGEMESQPAKESETDIGWTLYAGPWKPKPIGIV